jgi:hypothetical protein
LAPQFGECLQPGLLFSHFHDIQNLTNSSPKLAKLVNFTIEKDDSKIFPIFFPKPKTKKIVETAIKEKIISHPWGFTCPS